MFFINYENKYQLRKKLTKFKNDDILLSYVANYIKKSAPKFKFVNAIHPSIPIGDNVILGEGIVAMAGCIFNPRADIGDFTFFATGAQVRHQLKNILTKIC